jgi:predicted dehydrogenase
LSGEPLNIALVGCGVVGERRAQNLASARLVHCIDSDPMRAARLAAASPGCLAGTHWQAALDRADVDAVVIATPHDSLAEIARAAIIAGRHVLVEKPAARALEELLDLPQLAARHDVRVRVGFNLRYHRALQQARRLVDSGALGELLFVRARYGHGGRRGYENEWRAQPHRSGGGELLDQGVHLIDLARWFLGEFATVEGYAHTYYWNMPVEDNGFLLLRTASNQVAFMHASCTEWKNLFSWELCGCLGKLQIDGLGGSYGVEKLCWYRLLPEMGPPATTSWEYPMADNSWSLEMMEFIEDIRCARAPAAGLDDAIAALRIVERIYASCGYDHRA